MLPAEIPGSQDGGGRSVNLHQVDADYLKTTGIHRRRIGLRFSKKHLQSIMV
jgi:hypothetical protein